MHDLKQRTKQFALDVIRFCASLPSTHEFRMLTGQLIRAGTAVGANYRAACRAKSKPDFLSKVGTVEEEADECGYWLELIEAMPATVKVRCDAATLRELDRLKQEASELTAIMVSSKKTARGNDAR
jgi:four helix bundle protein